MPQSAPAMQLRPFLVWSHRWLGLTNSVVLVLAGLTGALVVFPFPEEPRELLIEFHVNLFAGEFGRWVVVVASVVTLLLQAGGLWLWWPSRSLRLRTTRGWWRFTYDFHNLLGVVSLPMMAMLAATGVGRVVFEFVTMPDALRLLPRAVGLLHHGEPFPVPVRALYVLGGLAFVVQTVTGVLMWWRPPAAARGARLSPSAPSPD
jgi:uncharacterized iron-regulated membrane protein